MQYIKKGRTTVAIVNDQTVGIWNPASLLGVRCGMIFRPSKQIGKVDLVGIGSWTKAEWKHHIEEYVRSQGLE